MMARRWIGVVFLLIWTGLLPACQHQGPSPGGQATDPPSRLLVTFVSSDDNTGGLVNSFSGSYFRSHWDAPLMTRRWIDAIEREYPVQEHDGWEIDILGVYCVIFDLEPGADPALELHRLRKDQRVESAQLVKLYQTQAVPTYNDPYFGVQYGVAQRYIQQLHQQSTGKGVDVAIIDTGVDAAHPDLQSQIFNTQVFVADTHDDFPGDIHGTAMAGIISASANNGIGIVGLAPDARIWALKACRQLHRRSSLAQCDSFTLAKALNFAIARHVDILNLSLSGPYDPLIERLIGRALERGQIVIAADPGHGEDRYPALLTGVIAAREAHQNGTVIQPDDAMVVVPPRTELLSTAPGGGYDYFIGSSNAAAVVSGLAAVLLQNSKAWSPQQKVKWLRQAVEMEQRWAQLSQNPNADLAPDTSGLKP